MLNNYEEEKNFENEMNSKEEVQEMGINSLLQEPQSETYYPQPERDEEASQKQVEIGATSFDDPYLQSVINPCRGNIFRDFQNTAYVVFRGSNGSKVFKVESEEFKDYISMKYFNLSGKIIKTSAINSVVKLVSSTARFGNSRKVNLEIRCNTDNDYIVYDINDDNNNQVTITPDGWRVAFCEKPLFKRYQHQLPQVLPVEDGSIDAFIDMLNVEATHRLLFKVYLVSLFIPGFAHPVLKIDGEKGSAKTTAVRLIKWLVDPSRISVLSFPRDNKEMVQQLDHHYFIPYDNLTSVPKWASDALCRAVTGDGYSVRKLYTSDDDLIRSFKRCISINGIDMGPLSDDLLDRSIIIQFNRISPENRKTEQEINSRFTEILPGVLGDIFTIISRAMKIYPTVSLGKVFRLADFTKWGYAIAQAIDNDHGGERFIADYKGVVELQEQESADDDVLLTAINFFMQKTDNWKGTPTQLYIALKTIVENKMLDSKHYSWPKAANQLTRRLKGYKSMLNSQGIAVIFEGRTAVQRNIQVIKLNLEAIGKASLQNSVKGVVVKSSTHHEELTK